jgi:hypothetical protein
MMVKNYRIYLFVILICSVISFQSSWCGKFHTNETDTRHMKDREACLQKLMTSIDAENMATISINDWNILLMSDEFQRLFAECNRWSPDLRIHELLARRYENTNRALSIALNEQDEWAKLRSLNQKRMKASVWLGGTVATSSCLGVIVGAVLAAFIIIKFVIKPPK